MSAEYTIPWPACPGSRLPGNVPMASGRPLRRLPGRGDRVAGGGR